MESQTLFQFTPLREGRLDGNRRLVHFVFISIHAPPRGATNNGTLDGFYLFISIHAPPRGATPLGSFASILQRYFNSRPSARGDITADIAPDNNEVFQFTPLREGRLCGLSDNPQGTSISIHAPPRGATKEVMTMKNVEIFQFTPLREGRQKKLAENLKKVLFQFTPLREGRRKSCLRFGSRTGYFNSRPSARGDLRTVRQPAGNVNFNSRPSARGDQSDHGAERK